MSELLVLAAITLSGLSGVPGLFRPRGGAAGERFAALALCAAAVLACTGALGSLFGGWSRELSAPWSVPGGRLAIQLDELSALFVIQIALVSALGAWYGLGYWAQREHPENARKLRAFWGLTTAGMLLVVVAQNAVLFLMGWEGMALAAFLLLTTEDEEPAVRGVGFVYLVATRCGTLCLFAMFALLAAASGTLDLAGWSRGLASPLGDAILILGLVGFGLKAGLMPLHVWLPGAHASAPSHVSALMSGVLIKTGIYGLVRLTAECAAPPLWLGIALVAAGAVSGVLGLAFAIGQRDVKRLLAYSSVENIGVICMGLGVAVLGKSLASPALVVLGAAGALLHVWSHGLFKSLLFLAAGAVLHATGTRDLERLGGLWRRMPRTGAAFLIGCVAIAGFPPLNGFVSELVLFLGLFRLATDGGGAWLVGALAAPALAWIAALALACFARAFGALFLGQARSDDGRAAHDPGAALLAPMAVLVAGCLGIGLGAPLVARVLDAGVLAWAGEAELPALAELAPLARVCALGLALVLACLALGAWLWSRLRTAQRGVGTWDCGYAAPRASMQYTASSFGEMLVGFFSWALRPRVRVQRGEGPFPAAGFFQSYVPETVLERFLLPGFAIGGRVLGWLRPLQQGSIHLYLLYILVTLLVLLLWT